MNDLDRVRAWLASGALLAPVDATPSAVDLANALAQLCDAPGVQDSPARAALRRAIGPAQQLIFVLVDGLGCNLIEALPPASFLRRHTVMELRAVFPSTTAAALTSFATGAWPGRHAVVAWFTRLPDYDLTATMLPFVERFSERPLAELGVTPRIAFPHPSLLPSFGRALRTYHPAAISNSEYTQYQRGDGVGYGYQNLSDGVDAIIETIGAADHARPAPTFHYLYIPHVDSAEHYHGADSAPVRAALDEVDAALQRLSTALGDGARIVVSSDHGVLTVADDAKHILRPGDELIAALVAPPAGEPRVPMFHTKPGMAQLFADAFRRRHGEQFALLTTDEADALQLFGPRPMDDRTRRRVGDFIALGAGQDVLIYEPDGPTPVAALRGYHGGLAPAEMRIPLIVA